MGYATKWISIGLILFFITTLLQKYYSTEQFQDSENSPSKDTFAIVQYDNRELSKEHQTFVEINRKYAKLHGYDHFLIKNGYEDIPPYWAKVKCVKDKLAQYRGVLWIDTDACIINKKLSFDNAFDSDKDFTFSPDGPWFEGNMNAGVWFVRNTEMGREIIDKWFEQYNKGDWKKDKSGKWSSSGTWAGKTYEQGAFSDIILPKYKNNMDERPWYFLQGFYNTELSFTLHFAGPTLKKVQDIFLKDYFRMNSLDID